MSAPDEPVSGRDADNGGFAVESTEAGLQTLVPGVVPVTLEVLR